MEIPSDSPLFCLDCAFRIGPFSILYVLSLPRVEEGGYVQEHPIWVGKYSIRSIHECGQT